MDASDIQSAWPAELAARPWRQHAANLVAPPPTMLMQQELNLLHWLTSQYYQGQGLIVDAGCFLGGSTHALASGLAANPIAASQKKLIHSYDMFSTAGKLWYDFLVRFGLQRDQKFEDRFRQHLAQHAERVEVHVGDLLEQTWGREPIEILFLDICKFPPLHDHATRMWFPRLIPGRSILIQQDYGWWDYHWGNIMMEVFGDRFIVLDDVPVASRVYLCTHAISEAEAVERVYAKLPDADKLRHMEAAIASVREPTFREHLWLNSAELAKSLGRSDLIERALTQIFINPAPGPAGAAARRRFPQYFVGPDDLSLAAGLDDPRLARLGPLGLAERHELYSLVESLRPQRVLQIGRSRGGTTILIAAALANSSGALEVEPGRIVALEDRPSAEHVIEPALVARLAPTVTFLAASSADELANAAVAAGGKFDLLVIDPGGHKDCRGTILGCLPLLNDKATIVLHVGDDARVRWAIEMALSAEPGLTDGGWPRAEGGLRLLHFCADRWSRECRVDGAHKKQRRRRNSFSGRISRLVGKMLGRTAHKP